MIARAAAPLRSLVLATWVELLLAPAAAWAMAASLSDARWVDNDQPIINLLFGGLFIGWLLSISRFKSGFSAFYSAFLSIIFGVQAIGRIIPSLSQIFSQDFFTLVNSAHTRLWALSQRAQGWYVMVNIRHGIEDEGFFIILAGLIAWNVTAWMAWSIFRRRKALEGLLPYGLLLAVNISFSEQGNMALWVVLLILALLMARLAFSRYTRDWDRRRVDYPWELSDWALSAVFLTAAIAMVALLAPVVATPEGWEKINKLIARMRAETSQTAQIFLAEVNSPPIEKNPRINAVTPNMQNIGDPIPDSPDVVMFVTVSDPSPPPPQSGMQDTLTVPKHYWRNSILSRYNGSGWEPLVIDPRTVPVLPEDEVAGRYLLRQRYQIVANHGGDLFTVNVPVEARGKSRLVYLPAGQIVSGGNVVQPGTTLVRGDTSDYQVVSWATRVDAGLLRSASTDYSSEISYIYLDVPDRLPQRVRQLAERITTGASTPYDKAVRIQNYLRETYPYNLRVPPPRRSQDAVDYFLFESPAGTIAQRGSHCIDAG